MTKNISFSDLKKQWMQDKDFVKAYQELELEHSISVRLIEARLSAKLTQEDIALRMGTKQSVIARLESGKVLPSLRTLSQYAKATGHYLDLQFL